MKTFLKSITIIMAVLSWVWITICLRFIFEISCYMLDWVTLSLWLLSLPGLWILKHMFSKNIMAQVRYFIAYFLVTAIILLFWIGKTIIPDTDFRLNFTTEIIGVGITALIIDRIYQYVNYKNEQLYVKLALRTCRMPIYTYCAFWLNIFQLKELNPLEVLAEYKSLEDFFLSDKFRNAICSFDFNGILLGSKKTYAQYYEEKMNYIKDRFQSILVKYASKLPQKELMLLEHFADRAFVYTVFTVMKFMSEVKFSSQYDTNPEVNIRPFINSLKDINEDNFRKHFKKLVTLIDAYNNSVENDCDKWTIKNIYALQTVLSANENPATEW